MSNINLYHGFTAEQRGQVADWLIVHASEHRRVLLEQFESEVEAAISCRSGSDLHLRVKEIRWYYWSYLRSLLHYLHSLGVIVASEFHEILLSTEFRMNSILSRHGVVDCLFDIEPFINVDTANDLFDKKCLEKSEVYK